MRTRRFYLGTKVKQYSQENKVWHFIFFFMLALKRFCSTIDDSTRESQKLRLQRNSTNYLKIAKSTNRVHSRHFKEASSATFLRRSYLSISLVWIILSRLLLHQTFRTLWPPSVLLVLHIRQFQTHLKRSFLVLTFLYIGLHLSDYDWAG